MIKAGPNNGNFTKEIVAFNESLSTHPDGSPAPGSGLHHNRALILNSSYQPIKLVNWQKALLLWFQGKVEVLEYHSSQVCSARETFYLPSVLRLKKYVAPRRALRLKFSRENIYLRDNYTCQYCAKRLTAKDLTLDHVVPASKFGRKDWTNMVTACRSCNHRKGNRTPIGAGMPLLSEPRIPNWLPSLRPEFATIVARAKELNGSVPSDPGDFIPEAWKTYLGTG